MFSLLDDGISNTKSRPINYDDSNSWNGPNCSSEGHCNDGINLIKKTLQN